MDELDRMLGRIRLEPLPGALGELDGAVMAGLAVARERTGERKALSLACGVAAMVGLWGGLSGTRPRDDGLRAMLELPKAAPSQLLAS